MRAALAACCAVALAACGGAARTRTNPYGPASSPYAMSKCMRANGLSHFPDPSQGSGGVGFPGGITLSNTGELTVGGVTFNGPALKAAERVCARYLPGGGGPPPRLSAQEQAAALRFAVCMRTHGVPGFPDPGIGPGGSRVRRQGIDKGSPAVRHAIVVCSAQRR